MTRQLFIASCACLVFLASSAVPRSASAQENTRQPMTQAEIDSLIEVQNRRIFPLYGERIARLGIALPMPVGVSLQYYAQEQGMVFDSLSLGISGSDQIPLPFVEFSDSRVLVFSASARADVWVLPFLNLYGILGRMQSHSDITLSDPIPLTVRVQSEGTTVGVGTIVSGGFKRLWGTANVATTWTFVPALVSPARATVIGLRVGTNLHLGFVDKTLSLWAGALHQGIGSETSGSSAFDNWVPGNIEEIIGDYEEQEWYQDLPPPVQQRVDQLVERLLEIDPSGETIDYTLTKEPLKPWNFIFGAQASLSPNWNFRTELGLGDRKSLLVGLEYRFAFK